MNAQNQSLVCDVTDEDMDSLKTFVLKEDLEGVKSVVRSLLTRNEECLFVKIGCLTREMHDAICRFELDLKKSIESTTHDSKMTDAQQRLNYVIDLTAEAANTTLDKVEEIMPMSRAMEDKIQSILSQGLDSGKTDTDQIHSGQLEGVLSDLRSLSGGLSEIIMAQEFQDLTGQVIKRVISLVGEVESSLVNMIKAASQMQDMDLTLPGPSDRNVDELEGPVTDKNKENVVHGQDDVDDLLSSLGF